MAEPGMVVQNIGPVTAYAYAVAGGYKGTLAEFKADLAKLAENVTQVREDKESASTSANNAAVSETNAKTSETNAASSAAASAESARTAEEAADRIADLRTYVTPQMYGAVGDGTADDTEAFLAASQTGETIIIPDGTYLVSAPISLSVNVFGLGRPTIKSNTEIDCIFHLTKGEEEKYITGVTFSGMNIIGENCDSAIKMTNVRNCKFSNLRITNSNNAITLVQNCWANIFDNCVFYNNVNGIYGVASTVNLETTNFENCYFGTNENAILTNDFQGCFFHGGWFEFNQNCIRLICHQNVAQNAFIGVDFEFNPIIIHTTYFDETVSPTMRFTFDSCSFASDSDRRTHLLYTHNDYAKWATINIDYKNCREDTYFRLCHNGCNRANLGVDGLTRKLTAFTYNIEPGYISPDFVHSSSREYKVPSIYKQISNDGKTITVNLPQWVYLISSKINKVDVSCVATVYFITSVTDSVRNGTIEDGNTEFPLERAVRRLVFTSDNDISDAEITLLLSWETRFAG